MKNFIFSLLLILMNTSTLMAQPVSRPVTSIEQSESAPLAEARLFETVDLLMNELPAPGVEIPESKLLRHTRMRDDLLRQYSSNFPERFSGDQFQPELIDILDARFGGPAIRFFTNGVVDDFPGAGFTKVARTEEASNLSVFGTNEVEIFEFKSTLEENDEHAVARDPSGWQGCSYEMRFHPRLLRYFLFREICYKTSVNEEDGAVTRSKITRYARWAYMFESPASARSSEENLDEYHERKWQAAAAAETLQCPGGEKAGGKLRLHCAWYENFSSKDYVAKLLSPDARPASEALLCQAPEGGFHCGFLKKCPYRLMWRAKKFDPYQTWSSDFIEAKNLQPAKGFKLKTKNWKLDFALNPVGIDQSGANQSHAFGIINVPKDARQISGTQKLRCRWVD